MRLVEIMRYGFATVNVKKTQSKSTEPTYKHILEHVNRTISDDLRLNILDYGSGLGYGSKYIHINSDHSIESFEPYYNDKTGVCKPTYTSYHDIIINANMNHHIYDVIISNCVLNVIPDDIRALMLKRMYNLLTIGGRIYINVQTMGAIRQVMKNGNALSDSEVITTRGTYQKGFTRKSLTDYVKSILPDSVITSGDDFSKVGIIVHKRR